MRTVVLALLFLFLGSNAAWAAGDGATFMNVPIMLMPMLPELKG